MNIDLKKQWENCLRFICDNLNNEEQFKAWFEPISAESFVDDTLVLRVPTAFYVEQLEGKYFNLLAAKIEKSNSLQ